MQSHVCYKAYGRDFYIEADSIPFAAHVFQDEYKVQSLQGRDIKTIIDFGAHVGSFTVMCHELWPNAKIIAVEPHPFSFELLQRNTAHIPSDQLQLCNVAITQTGGSVLMASAPSQSRVGEYVAEVWQGLGSPRPSTFGVPVNGVTTKEFWELIVTPFFGGEEIDILKADCEGAEYLIFDELGKMNQIRNVKWVRGEWHNKSSNPTLEHALCNTHTYHIDPNIPHSVGLFIAHRRDL